LLNKYFYRRKLPHWQPPHGTFFITYRLAGSVPKSNTSKLKPEYQRNKKQRLKKAEAPERYFELFEQNLENNVNGPHWLKIDQIASIVHESLHFRNTIDYQLWAECIMSNHVHLLLSPLKEDLLLNKILQNHKKFTAVHCNKYLKKRGSFWQAESFDTLIRNNNHFFNCVHYTLQNPVKAGLVTNWKEWKWSYINPKIEEAYLAIFEKHYL
jgi:putative transposase